MKIFRDIKYLLTTDLGELVCNVFVSKNSKDYIRLAINFFIAQIVLRVLGFFAGFLSSFIYPIASILGQIGFLLLAYGVILKVIDKLSKTNLMNLIQPKQYSANVKPQMPVQREVLELEQSMPEEEIEQILVDREEETTNRILTSYYTQVLRQSAISFTYSLVFAAIGFLVIIFSIFPIEFPWSQQNQVQSEITQQASDHTSYLPGLISGIVIEAVSALIFVQTNNARKTMIEFSEKIRLDRRLNESLELIDKIPNEKIQSRVKALLVLNFSGIVMKYDDQEILQQVINTQNKDE